MPRGRKVEVIGLGEVTGMLRGAEWKEGHVAGRNGGGEPKPRGVACIPRRTGPIAGHRGKLKEHGPAEGLECTPR